MKNELNIIPSASEPTTITILEGEALPQKPPRSNHFIGNINSISAFLNVRKGKGTGLQAVDASKVVVEVDEAKNQIDLHLDPDNFYNTRITARLEISDELKAFAINKNVKYNQQDLVKLLKFNRLRFFDQSAYETVFKAAAAFSFKAELNSGSTAQDSRGNKSIQFEKKVHSDMPPDFILAIPIFKGQEIKKFRVELVMDTTEGSARFWFESVELEELIEIERKKIFDEELKSCEGFVIIRK